MNSFQFLAIFRSKMPFFLLVILRKAQGLLLNWESSNKGLYLLGIFDKSSYFYSIGKTKNKPENVEEVPIVVVLIVKQ